MAPKRALLLTFGNDSVCDEAKKFILDAGILLDLRDLEKNPLNEQELKRMIGHIDLQHFINPMTPEYEKTKMSAVLDKREEVIKILAENNNILKRPIIRTARLLTVGCNKKKISEMLQISMNGNSQSNEESKGNLKSSGYVTRRTSSSKSNSRSSESSAKSN